MCPPVLEATDEVTSLLDGLDLLHTMVGHGLRIRTQLLALALVDEINREIQGRKLDMASAGKRRLMRSHLDSC